MKRIIGSVLGNALSILGVTLNADQMDKVESIVSIICMIVGLLITIISAIIIPLVKWYKNAKQDGIIDDKEMDDGLNILQNGIDEVQDQLKKGEEKDEDNSRNDE